MPKQKAKAKKGSKKKKKRNSKGEGFLESIKKENPMLKYFSDIGLMNPGSQRAKLLNPTDRKGTFVSIAHANQEFTAPKITKGKSASNKKSKKK